MKNVCVYPRFELTFQLFMEHESWLYLPHLSLNELKVVYINYKNVHSFHRYSQTNCVSNVK